MIENNKIYKLEGIKEHLFINFDNEELEDIANYLIEVVKVSRELIQEEEENEKQYYNGMELMEELPQGWDFKNNDIWFINNDYYILASNNKSLFGGEYKHGLVRKGEK